MNSARVESHVESLPGTRVQQWVDYHRQVAAPSTTAYEFAWDLTEDAIGPFCTDVDGNVLLDFTSHVAATPLGYNNPTLEAKMEAFDLPSPPDRALRYPSLRSVCRAA